MAKRRFNKYAHRQYLASRQRDAAAAADPRDAAPERVDVLHDGSDASEPAEPDPSDPLDAAVWTRTRTDRVIYVAVVSS